MIAGLRALMALVLLIGVYVLLLAIVCFWALFAVAGIWSAVVSEPFQIPIGSVYLVVFLFPVMLAIGSALIALTRTEPLPEGSTELIDRQHPLWLLVADLASGTGIAPPSQIRLIAEPQAAVAESRLLLGLIPARQPILFVGMPIITQLPRSQFKAVLAHELGHYGGQHTAFGISIARGANALRTGLVHITAAAEGSPQVYGYSRLVAPLLSGYWRMYERIARTVQHRHEYQADAAAAEACGPGPLIEALKSAAALQVLWKMDASHRPFAETVRASRNSGKFDRLRDTVVTSETGGKDSTHPPLADRIDAIKALPARLTAVAADDQPLCTAEDLLESCAGNLPVAVRRRDISELQAAGDMSPVLREARERRRAKARAWRTARLTTVPMMVLLGLVWMLRSCGHDDVEAHVPPPECAGVAPVTALPSAALEPSLSSAGITELWDAYDVVRISAGQVDRAKLDEGRRGLASLGVTPPAMPTGRLPTLPPVPLAAAEGALAISLDELADTATQHFDRDLAASATNAAIAIRRHLAESDQEARMKLAAALVRYATALVTRDQLGSVPSGVTLPFGLERTPLTATQAAVEAGAIYRDLPSPELATATAVLARACAAN